MFIPGANAPITIPEDAALGILATALTALAKASKTNSTAPIGILLKERLSVGERKALNVMLHAMGGAIAKAGNKSRKRQTVNPSVSKAIVKGVNKPNVVPSLSELLRNALRVKP